jgi:hypothetical protein
MDPSVKTWREANDFTLEFQSMHEVLPINEVDENNLRQLLVYICWLEQTPQGATDLQRRITLFGDCRRSDSETSDQFHARLRNWLDRELPKSKLHRHATRQTSN